MNSKKVIVAVLVLVFGCAAIAYIMKKHRKELHS